MKKKISVPERILRAVKRRPITTDQISRRVRANKTYVSRTLVELARRKRIKRVQRGVYQARA